MLSETHPGCVCVCVGGVGGWGGGGGGWVGGWEGGGWIPIYNSMVYINKQTKHTKINEHFHTKHSKIHAHIIASTHNANKERTHTPITR